MDQKSATINSLQISYSHKAAVNKRLSLVFVHGFPFNKGIWDNQMAALPAEVEGIAYDIRGFGESSTDHSFFSIDLFARDLKVFIDSLSLSKIVLCGISMGGYIALRFAELFPEAVSGLILCDTNSIADSSESKAKRFASIDLLQRGGKEEFTEGFVKNVFSESTLNNNPEVVCFLKTVIGSSSDETICATQLALAARTDTSNVLGLVQVPALIIRGEEDKLMSVEQTQQLHNGLKGSELVNIPSAGHLPNLEQPEAFNEAMLSFLRKHF